MDPGPLRPGLLRAASSSAAPAAGLLRRARSLLRARSLAVVAAPETVRVGVKAEAGENGEGAEGQGQGTGEGPDEGGTVGEPGTPEPGGLDSVGPLTEGTGGGNASPPPPVPDLPPDLPPKPGGARFVVRSDGTVTDSAEPAATRPYMRVDTRKAILDATEKTPEGDFVDPNTREVIPKEGPFDIGHRPGYEWWRTQQIAREEGWTREQLIEYENDPSHFQIEARGVNRGRTFELP